MRGRQEFLNRSSEIYSGLLDRTYSILLIMELSSIEAGKILVAKLQPLESERTGRWRGYTVERCGLSIRASLTENGVTEQYEWSVPSVVVGGPIILGVERGGVC